MPLDDNLQKMNFYAMKKKPGIVATGRNINPRKAYDELVNTIAEFYSDHVMMEQKSNTGFRGEGKYRFNLLSMKEEVPPEESYEGSIHITYKTQQGKTYKDQTPTDFPSAPTTLTDHTFFINTNTNQNELLTYLKTS